MAEISAALVMLRRKQVENRVGLSRSSIYSKIAAGEFPAPIKLSSHASGWIESEVNNWLAERVRQSRQPAKA